MMDVHVAGVLSASRVNNLARVTYKKLNARKGYRQAGRVLWSCDLFGVLT